MSCTRLWFCFSARCGSLEAVQFLRVPPTLSARAEDKTNGKKALAFVPLENPEAQELCNVIASWHLQLETEPRTGRAVTKRETRIEVTRMMETPGLGLAEKPHVEQQRRSAMRCSLFGGELPEDLRKNPLYETQGLLETGFQLELLKVPKNSGSEMAQRRLVLGDEPSARLPRQGRGLQKNRCSAGRSKCSAFLL